MARKKTAVLKAAPPADSLTAAIYGTLNDDVLSGRQGYNNTIFGKDGHDTISGANLRDGLYGGNGNDRIFAGGGNDVVDGGAGADIVNAGTGNDEIRALNDGDVIDGGAGTDVVSYAQAAGAVYASLKAGHSFRYASETVIDTYANVENLGGSAFDDSLEGNANANTLSGGAGNDTLAGGLGADTLMGGAGDDLLLGEGTESGGIDVGDRLYGDAGNDTLRGYAGNDQLDGGDGDDLLNGGQGRDALSGGKGIDTADYSDDLTGHALGHGVIVDLTRGIGYRGHAEGDTLTGIENVVSTVNGDRLTGDMAANVLDGGMGSDTLTGMAGRDTLVGGTGSDFLLGGAGADHLWGSVPGAVSGDGMRDYFRYEASSDSFLFAMDTIHDFDQNAAFSGDRIVLDFDAKTGVSGMQDFVFIGDGDFTGAGQLRSYFSKGDTYVAANTGGGLEPEFVLKLSGLYELTASDFIL
ncbi:calcium-binding protein [Ensifer soli]|uniref:calcium-binding protein n=1 Tax=Ciceribacter sp. sgz301302 TaxID=3342379 RepID=UPI0035B9C553